MTDWSRDEKYVNESLSHIQEQLTLHRNELAEQRVQLVKMELRITTAWAASEARIRDEISKKNTSFASLKTKVGIFSGGISVFMSLALGLILKFVFLV